MAKYTITFDEAVKGWTSFHSFQPDFMVGLNNNFFTIKDGQLYLHNDETNDTRNNFYGVQYDTKFDFIFNDAPSDVKSYKTINIEGDTAWDIELITNLTNGSILQSEFLNKEDEWYAHIRRSEDSTDYSSLSIQGLGSIDSIDGLDIILVSQINDSLSIGDVILKFDGEVLEQVGTCTDVNGNVITVGGIEVSISSGDLLVFSKDVRVESSMIRGYYMLVKMTNQSTRAIELFAVNSEIFKSFE